jgi:putative DNA primase/helicase
MRKRRVKKSGDIVGAALKYASRGWHVFPSPPGTKMSYKSAKNSDGRKWGATTDHDEIRGDWSEWPRANLGIATGALSGLFVIDLDTPEGHDGKDGVGTFEKWIEEHSELPPTIQARTPSGGLHLYFKWPDDLIVQTSAGKLAEGIDIRGDRGIVLGVPSVKPDGRSYQWKNPPDQFDLAECPKWLLDKIKATQGRNRSTSSKALEEFTPSDKVWDWLSKEQLLGSAQSEGWWETTCPWANEHSDNDTRAYYLPRGGPNPRRGFNCFHSHVYKIEDFLDWVEKNGGPKADVEDLPSWQLPSSSGGQPRANATNAIELNQDALAKLMGERGWNEDARYVASWKKWLFWDGTHWCVDERLSHMTRTRDFIRWVAAEMMRQAEQLGEGLSATAAKKLLDKAKREGDKLRDKHVICAIELLARSNPESVANPSDFNADPMLLGTPNGTVDLRAGKLRPALRTELITKQTSVAPARAGNQPRLWLKFLNEIFEGDQDVIAFMQRAAGYALTGEVSEHKLLFLYGGGRNGKSVFLNTLFDIWGDYARKAASATFLNSKQERHPTDVAGLQGARLVAGSELPVGKTWDESVIKDLTGGDVMTARFMRGDFFDFTPQLTLMIAGNNQPSFRGVDEAIRARVVLVPFNVTIPEEQRDADLPSKLKAEAPEILQWAIEGALQWQQMGLNVPAAITAASSKYFDAEDTVGRFLVDETVDLPGNFVASKSLHTRFSSWCAGEGLTPFTQLTLIKDIRKRGYVDAKSGGKRGLKGLELRPLTERGKIIAALRSAAA